MCVEKPNGSVWIILNLNSLKGKSVNFGIDKSEFPAVMSSTSKWLGVLNKAGRCCSFVKIDWADAYSTTALLAHPAPSLLWPGSNS